MHRLAPVRRLAPFATRAAHTTSIEAATSAQRKSQRERELLVNVVSSVSGSRDARKFLRNVSAPETMRSARQFEEQQALAALADRRATHRPHHGELLRTRTTPDTPGRTLAALVVLDARHAQAAGPAIAQMQRLGVAPIVYVDSRSDSHMAALSAAHGVADAIERAGGRSRPVAQAFIGDTVDDSDIRDAVAGRVAPVVAPVRVDAGRLTVEARDAAVPRLVAAVGKAADVLVARVIVLGHELADARGSLERLVNLAHDGTRGDGTRALVAACLRELPPTAAAVVAAADAQPAVVLRGLISERPAGARDASQFTLLRRGFTIRRFGSLASCDRGRLRALLEASFGRVLDANAYFARLERLADVCVIVAGEYQGAVVVTHEPVDGAGCLPYLDKFAVAPTEQGTGMADILWAQLREACPVCFWRSRSDNAVNRWYFDRASGHFRAPEAGGSRWVFFWYGDVSVHEAKAAVGAAQRIPPSFLAV